jgi:hypothetical protein
MKKWNMKNGQFKFIPNLFVPGVRSGVSPGRDWMVVIKTTGIGDTAGSRRASGKSWKLYLPDVLLFKLPDRI